MYARPILRAIKEGGSGANIFAGPLGQRLVSVTVSDQRGQESDAATIVLADPGRRLPLPRKGEKYRIYMGWEMLTGPVLQGLYEVQTIGLGGGADAVELMTIQLRAADFIEGLKAVVRQHFDENTTVGKLFGDVARQAGLSGAVVPADLAGLKLGYRLCWDQSRMDFATQIAGEIGARAKPAGGKLVVMKSGSGQSGGGKDLQVINVRKRQGYSWNVEIEPRPVYGHVAAAWLDPKTGRRQLVKQATGKTGPYHILPHPYVSEDAAKKAAEAEAYELGNNSGTGFFERPGHPFARAEAVVNASEYGAGIDGRWQCESVESTVTADGGYRTTVNVGAGKEVK